MKLELKKVPDPPENEDYNESRIEFIKRKQAEGYDIYIPSDNELTIDIDSVEDLRYYHTKIERLERELMEFPFEKQSSPKIDINEYNSKTVGHKHIIIKLPFDVTPAERIALQASLGSDRTRELLSTFRLLRNDKHPSLLCVEKGKLEGCIEKIKDEEEG